ncbi:hypothetical protein NQ318_007535 [Aromia moschata]|uniref:Uncharacterized protein n=1 Tax=Aromia moschata TaxID=1265417 RepID=A0AAV8YG67_9CUCU|nr:hypothetical protein NQ318_007535 [Aromia moschata]
MEIIGPYNTDTLDAFIDLNTLKSADMTLEEANYKVTNLRQDNILNNDQEKLEKNSSTNCYVSKGINANEIGDLTNFQNNIDVNYVEKKNSGESSSEGEENVASDNENKKRKRKKNILSNSQDWEYNTNKKRQEGASYMGRKDNKYVVQKNERKLKMRCSCEEKGGRAKTTDISKILELHDMGRKKYLSVEERLPQVPNGPETENLKGRAEENALILFFLDKKKERVRVCKTMFCNTLGVSMRTITHWLNRSVSSPITKKRDD